MKKHKLLIVSAMLALCTSTAVHAQFGGLGKKLLDKGTEIASGGGLNKKY